MKPFVLHTYAARPIVANCCIQRLSLNAAWLIMYSPYMRHLREILEGSHHASAMKENLCHHLYSLSSLCTQLFSPCIHTVDAPAQAILNVAADTTAVPGTKGPHTPAAIPGYLLQPSSFKLTLELADCLSCTKILLMVRMWPTAMTLNYSVKSLRNDV